MTVTAHKISGRRQWVVTVECPGGVHGNVKIPRGAFSNDGPSPDLMTLRQIETDHSAARASLLAGERSVSAGYVVTWDRDLAVYCTDSATVRAVFVEGSH